MRKMGMMKEGLRIKSSPLGESVFDSSLDLPFPTLQRFYLTMI